MSLLCPTSSRGHQWTISSYNHQAKKLEEALNLSPLMAQLLWQRGLIDIPQAHAFLDPKLSELTDPFTLQNLASTAQRVANAIEQKEKIVIFGDYDVDGITSTALLWRVLTLLGAEVETFLPHRIDEGYGLSQDSIERCYAEHHPQILIAVDCGTTSVAQVEWLQQHDIEVIIVDHHELPPTLPSTSFFINPHQDQQLLYLASVGLVFKLLHGLLKLCPQFKKQVDLRHFIDLVALGTVADLVPLLHDNRILVQHGLRQLQHTYNPGLRALLTVAQIRGTPSAADIGFRLGPRLNASGRLGDASRSLQLLKTNEGQEALEIAKDLDQKNRERQTLERETFEQALALAEKIFDPEKDFALILSQEGWHIGVIGIVASRLQKRYHRPTFIIALDEQGVGKGSGRSIEGFSLIDALQATQKHLLLFGGHEMAAGLSITKDQLPDFKKHFCHHAQTVLHYEQLQPTLEMTSCFPSQAISQDLYFELKRLGPFGQKNPEPIFVFSNIQWQRPLQFFGHNHFKLFLKTKEGTCEAVAFNLAEQILPREGWNLAGILDWNPYRHQIQIRILDWCEPGHLLKNPSLLP